MSSKSTRRSPPTNVDPNEGVGTPQGATNETNEPKETNEDKGIKKSKKSDLKFELSKEYFQMV